MTKDEYLEYNKKLFKDAENRLLRDGEDYFGTDLATNKRYGKEATLTMVDNNGGKY